MQKQRIRYIRYQNSPIGVLITSENLQTGVIKCALSICGHKDTFSRSKGKMIALARLEKANIKNGFFCCVNKEKILQIVNNIKNIEGNRSFSKRGFVKHLTRTMNQLFCG